VSAPQRDIETASRAFNDVADIVSIDGLIVDAGSGEVIEWPAGITGDKFEWLTFRATQHQANIDGHKQALGIINQALGRMLSQAGQRSIRTPYGTPRYLDEVWRLIRLADQGGFHLRVTDCRHNPAVEGKVYDCANPGQCHQQGVGGCQIDFKNLMSDVHGVMVL